MLIRPVSRESSSTDDFALSFASGAVRASTITCRKCVAASGKWPDFFSAIAKLNSTFGVLKTAYACTNLMRASS